MKQLRGRLRPTQHVFAGARTYARAAAVAFRRVHEELRLGVSDSERHKLLHLVPNELIATLQGPDEQGATGRTAIPLRCNLLLSSSSPPGALQWPAEQFVRSERH
eukprot:SAG11_NODE_1449_length_4885_cov_4.394066_2_plen_105_part_00